MLLLEWNIEDIKRAFPALYVEHHVAMCVAHMRKISRPVCKFRVQCQGLQLAGLETENEFGLRIRWNQVTEEHAERIVQTEQFRPQVERAAVAIASLLIGKFFRNASLRAAEERSRVDYWLPQLGYALEISGTAATSRVPQRVRQKTMQVLSNAYSWDGFVIVVSFDPRQPLIHWSFHRQGQDAK